MDYVKYVYNGLMNLFLPGIPYFEAYVLSSQYLFDVLSFEKTESTLSKIELLKQDNTQSFTLFGSLTLILGIKI